MLSADAWGAFEDTAVIHQPTWDRFRESVLEGGGSRPAAENFLVFCGLAPTPSALLRQRGIDGTALAANG